MSWGGQEEKNQAQVAWRVYQQDWFDLRPRLSSICKQTQSVTGLEIHNYCRRLPTESEDLRDSRPQYEMWTRNRLRSCVDASSRQWLLKGRLPLRGQEHRVACAVWFPLQDEDPQVWQRYDIPTLYLWSCHCWRMQRDIQAQFRFRKVLEPIWVRLSWADLHRLFSWIGGLRSRRHWRKDWVLRLRYSFKVCRAKPSNKRRRNILS